MKKQMLVLALFAGSLDIASGISAVTLVGYNHICAFSTNCTVVCWGVNGVGQLGIGTNNNVGYRANEMGNNLAAVNLGTGQSATAIAGGSDFTCVMRTNGTVVCWGQNDHGELGIGNTAAIGYQASQMGNNLVPVNFGTGLYAVSIYAGATHSCAIRNDGRLVCWGSNRYGECGVGTSTHIGDQANEMGNTMVPVDLGTGLNATFVSLGSEFSCVIRNDSRIVCWGRGTSGQLGNGVSSVIGDNPYEMGDNLTVVNLETMLLCPSCRSPFVYLASGQGHSCVLRANGTVHCWGANNAGQCGVGHALPVSIPQYGTQYLRILPVDLGTGFIAVSISLGDSHVCAVRNDSKVVCWGENGSGQLGIGNTLRIGDEAGEMGNYLVPTDLGTGFGAPKVFAAYGFNCAIRSDGSVVCWGANNFGYLGIGNTITIGDGPNEMGNNLTKTDLGSVGSGGLCGPCTAGSFSNVAGGTRASSNLNSGCTQCRPGSYSNSTSTSNTACSQCSPGFYSNSTGSTLCNSCLDGTLAPSVGSTSCTSCSAWSCQSPSGKCDPQLLNIDLYSRVERGITVYYCNYSDGNSILEIACSIPADYVPGRNLACKVDDSTGSNRLVCV